MAVRQAPGGSQALAGWRDAVVIGGGMAGLMAAAVLSRRYRTVTVLDRDRFAERPAPRPGVPWSVHLHARFDRGGGAMERISLGIGEELAAAGAVELDAGLDLDWCTPSGPAPRFDSGRKVLACSLPLLEWTTRKRVAAIPNVRLVEGAEVTGLTANLENTRISGLTFRIRGESTLLPVHRGADLVVDASGRGSRMPDWLKRLNHGAPRETPVNGHMGYAARLFYRSPGWPLPFRACYSQAQPPKQNRSGGAYPIEGNRWIVSLAGGDGDYPPSDENGFLEFAASLPNPHIHRLATACRPLGPITGIRGGENRFRHYEEIAMPRGVVVLGDATCAINPMYGHGMSVAAAGAEALAECLDHDALDTFQARLAAESQAAWTRAASEDMRFANVEGVRPSWRLRLTHKYLDRVIALSARDVNVRKALFEAGNLTPDAGALVSPSILAGVLSDMIFPRPAEVSSPVAAVRASTAVAA